MEKSMDILDGEGSGVCGTNTSSGTLWRWFLLQLPSSGGAQGTAPTWAGPFGRAG